MRSWDLNFYDLNNFFSIKKYPDQNIFKNQKWMITIGLNFSWPHEHVNWLDSSSILLLICEIHM